MSALRDAYERIKDPDRWCTGAEARDKDGAATNADHPQAARWCVVGALVVSGATLTEISIIGDVSDALFDASPPTVNDNRGHAAVLQMLEKAIVEEEGGL